jgi:hypothetical protein
VALQQHHTRRQRRRRQGAVNHAWDCGFSYPPLARERIDGAGRGGVRCLTLGFFVLGRQKMITAELKQRLTEEGVSGSLCFVATRADVGIRSELQADFGLSKDVPLLECLLERNARVKERMRQDFFGGKSRKAPKGAEDSGTQVRSVECVGGFELRTLTVSALEFQKLEASRASREACLFKDAEQTEIPALQRLVPLPTRVPRRSEAGRARKRVEAGREKGREDVEGRRPFFVRMGGRGSGLGQLRR